MLKGSCINPKLLSALAHCGHGDKVLIADGNYPLASKTNGAELVYLGMMPGTPTVTQVLEAVQSVPAKTVFVLPNNKNIIMAAEQAQGIADRTIVVLSTRTIPQGITAMLNFDPDASEYENATNMMQAADKVATGLVTFAARDSDFDGRKIKKGEILALENGKLVATGFVERKRAKKAVSLVPAHTGVSLITVLPEQLQSPLLTAEWEYRLQQVERGELSPDEFMTGIADMLTELVKTYKVISGAEVLFPSGREIIGKCPRCGGDVTESKKGFFCEKNDCRFGLWRDNKFFAAKRAALTKKVAAALLADGRVKLTGLYSEKTGGTYDATAVLEDTGESVRFRLEFDKGART